MNAILHERNNAEVYRMQYEMREQSKAAALQNIRRVEEIKELQLQLRDKFIETNELVQRCEEKERNAERCIAAEMDKQKQLNDDIEQISAELKVLTEFQKKFEGAINDLKPYEDVLDEVVAESNLFKSKKDVLDRCDALCELFAIFVVVVIERTHTYIASNELIYSVYKRSTGPS